MRVVIVSALLASVALHCNAEDSDQGVDRYAKHERALKVFDARGTLVGRLANEAAQEGVFLRVDGVLISAPVQRRTLSASQ